MSGVDLEVMTEEEVQEMHQRVKKACDDSYRVSYTSRLSQ